LRLSEIKNNPNEGEPPQIMRLLKDATILSDQNWADNNPIIHSFLHFWNVWLNLGLPLTNVPLARGVIVNHLSTVYR